MKTVETKAWSDLEIAILKLCIAVNGVGKWETIRTQYLKSKTKT